MTAAAEKDLCPATGKVVRRSRARALEDAFAMATRLDARIEPYLCPHCGTWHLRNRNKSNRTRRRLLKLVVVQAPPVPVEPAPTAPWGRPEVHELLRRLGRER